MLSDLRQAARRLRHAPLFTLTAVLTLALGIGSTLAASMPEGGRRASDHQCDPGAATGLTAAWLPARRAGRVDPIEALRQE